jgi:hypothetical protein
VHCGAMYACFSKEEWELPTEVVLAEQAAREGKEKQEVKVSHHPLLSPDQGLYSCKFVHHALRGLEAATQQLEREIKEAGAEEEVKGGDRRGGRSSCSDGPLCGVELLLRVLVNKFELFCVRCASQTASNPTPNLVGLSALLQVHEYYKGSCQSLVVRLAGRTCTAEKLAFQVEAIVGRLMAITMQQLGTWIAQRWHMHFAKGGDGDKNAFVSKNPSDQQPASAWVVVLTEELFAPLVNKCANGYLHAAVTRRVFQRLQGTLVHGVFGAMLAFRVPINANGCLQLQRDLALVQDWVTGTALGECTAVARYAFLLERVRKRCEAGKAYTPTAREVAAVPDLPEWLKLAR